MHTKFARELRRNQTKAEEALWLQLRNRRFLGYKFRRQKPIGPYIVDFCCIQKKIIIELDGGQHAVQVAYDQRRTKFLEQNGFRIIRFWDNDMLVNTESVMEKIWTILNDNGVPSP